MLPVPADTRYAVVPFDLLDDDRLTSLAVRVYGAVAAHASRSHGWRAWPSVDTLTQIVGRGVRQVREALRLLVETGWLVVSGRRHGRSEWQLSASRSGEKPPLAEDDTFSSEQTREQTTTPPPSAAVPSTAPSHAETQAVRTSAAGSTVQEPPRPKGSTMTRKATPPPDQPALLPTETEAPKPTAQHLVAAWVDGYHQVRQTEPHPRLLRMVAGQAKSLAKDCETVEHWRVAWRACLAAGRAGKVSPAPFLADEQPRSMYAVPGARRSRDMVAEAQRRMQALPR